MDKQLTKNQLIRIAEAIKNNEKIDVAVVKPFLGHTFQTSSKTSRFMLKAAAVLSFFFASILVVFPEAGEKLIEILPGYFYLSERIANALDFIWGLVGKPVGERHLMYHVPNIIVYAFGFAGVRQLWRKISKNNWKDQVSVAQDKMSAMIQDGVARFTFAPGFSLLFVGNGDQIAKSLVIDDPEVGMTISSGQPRYTDLWGKYTVGDGEEGFHRVLEQSNACDAGEYVLFPVLDEHLFLPGNNDFDLAPHRIDTAIRKIREYEQTQGWEQKRIIIVGDNEQKSQFVTASREGLLDSHCDEVSLRSIAASHENITVLDPTEITLKEIIKIADGKQIMFRASDKGAEKYAKDFYHRLSLLGYAPDQDEYITIGYDITDLETEHQFVSRKQSGYLPVILSRDIFEELLKSDIENTPNIFVPRLVKQELRRLVAEQ